MVLYSTIGGMWSLTLTDIVQFLIMTVGLVFLLMPLSINDAGGWDALVAKLPASYFDFTAIGWDTIVTYFPDLLFGIFIGQTSGSGCSPPAGPWPRSPAPPPVSTACSTAWPGR